MSILTVSQIGEIRAGLFARPERLGDALYLQAKHFDESGRFQDTVKPTLKTDKITPNHLLRPGEILFAAKGGRNFAAVYNDERPAVASTTFLIITIYRSDIDPGYVAWALNNPVNLSQLMHRAMGSSIPSISKAVLGELEIKIPSFEKQRQILKITSLAAKEKELWSKMAKLREYLVEQQINKAIR